MGIGDDGVLVLVESDLPYPVTDVGRLVDDGGGILAGIAVGLAHVEHAVLDYAQLLSVQVAEDRPVALVDVNHIEIEPVRHLVVGMSGGVAHVNLVLPVALVFRIGACSRALHDLLRSEVELAVVVGVGHGKPCDGGMPVDASPAEVDMLWVVAQNERRGIGGVVGSREIFLIAESGDVARPG